MSVRIIVRILNDHFLTGTLQQVHRFFVSLEEPRDQLLEVLLGALSHLPHCIEEKIVILDLKSVQPGHRRPNRHVNPLHQLETLLQA